MKQKNYFPLFLAFCAVDLALIIYSLAWFHAAGRF
jgi:hypothetical protein